MNDPKEQRRQPRLQVSIPVGYYPKDRPWEVKYGEILNISSGGAFIQCRSPIPVGEEVMVEIRFREATFYSAMIVSHDMNSELKGSVGDPQKSKIRWIRKGTTAGMGIEFVDLTPDKKDFLKKLVDSFNPD